MCACLFVVLTITVTWLLGDTTFSQPKDLPMPPPLCVLLSPAAVMTTVWGVWIQWTGMVERTGMEWWNGLEWWTGMEWWNGTVLW